MGSSTLHLELATADDKATIAGIAALRQAVARDLTARYGKGHWSSGGTERGVLADVRSGRVYVARGEDESVVATLTLSTRKPWAIDTSYFTPCTKALYLTSMAVDPGAQSQGIGRRCLEDARRVCREWPADALRLDAYDAEAGAGEFYRRCGFREVGRVRYRGTPLVYFELAV